MSDASDQAVGAVLQQLVDNTWRPIAYFSKLRHAETRYSTFDRELLGVFLAVKHFSYFVEGREFYVLTDHKPLTYALSFRSGNRSPCQIRHLSYISQFTTDIRYMKGHENVMADALSRLELDMLQVDQQMSPVNFEDMAAAQHNDTELCQLTRDPPNATSLKFQSVPLFTSDSTIICDMSKGVPQPYVPAAFRCQVFNSLHSLAHPGIKVMQCLITDHFIWPRINADMRNWTRACLHCQHAKIQCHTTTPIAKFSNLDTRFNRLHLNIIGPLPPSDGCTYSQLWTGSLDGLKLSILLIVQQLPSPKLLSVVGFHVLEFPHP